MDKIEQMNMRDELGGTTELIQEKNIDQQQEMAEFSSPIQEVLDQPQAASMGLPSQEGYQTEGASVQRMRGQYPFGLKRHQVEALLAGVAAVIGTSDTVQSKLSEFVPQFYNDGGKVSLTGMALLVLVVAVVFYFGKQFILDRR